MWAVLCPICAAEVETVNHVFFSCEMAMDLRAMVARWWQVDIPILSCMAEWTNWIDTARVTTAVRKCLEAVSLALCWAIWCFRNKLLFDETKPVKAYIWDHIQAQSFLWINSRTLKFRVFWVDWVCNPYFSINFL